MRYEEASTWCIRHASEVTSGTTPLGGHTLTLSAFGRTVTAAVQEPTWEGWREALVLLVDHLRQELPS